MHGRDDLLFYKYDIRKVIEQHDLKLSQEIDGYERNYVLNASVDDLCDHLESEYRIQPVVLHKDKIYIKHHGETQVDVSQDYNRVIFERDGPFYIKGTAVTFAIPFSGDSNLFYCQGSTFTMNPPRATITDNEVLIIYERADPNPVQLKADFEKTMTEIEQHMTYVTNDIAPFNSSLRSSIRQKIETRKARLLKDSGIVASLGYPIKQSTGIPTTYTVPEIKRKVVIPRPVVTTSSFTPEPALDMNNYEAILKIISNMVLVMERSPHAFLTMDEESLRQHFLVQLNGHFEGAASGETFNYQGKTDILIREGGKNIFIAECMIWAGAQSLSEKIDQLLGYVSWRDTKTAILIFNRNKDFSNVLAQVPELINKHPNCKKQVLDYKNETGSRYILHHSQDKNREIILTVLAFDIPKIL